MNLSTLPTECYIAPFVWFTTKSRRSSKEFYYLSFVLQDRAEVTVSSQ